MATDFFQRQDAARQSTGWLVALFLLGVGGIVAAVAGVGYATVMATEIHLNHEDAVWEAPLAAGLVALLIIVLGTTYKVIALRSGGGQMLAESLGGMRLYPDTVGTDERRLLNVVEEMALASGTPTPPVFLLEEEGINAFAAGYTPSDAVLGVTRGAMQQLSRDQLQGVIAHEFSHILNGDMRMSIRLIGILHGILLLGLIGRGVMRMLFHSGARSSSHRRSGRSDSNSNRGGGWIILVIIGVSVALIVIGAIGSVIGGLIKAAVSRQREYLADASAVQFTRNPGGIAGALKRVGAKQYGSRIKAANAAEASHMFFAQGVWEGFSSLMATHPPLNQRILAIEPNWDGVFPAASPAGPASAAGAGVAAFAGAPPADGSAVPLAVVDHAAEQIGEPTDLHRQYAQQLLDEIPKAVLSAARETYGARAVVFGLLLDDDPTVREKQFAALTEFSTPDVIQMTRKLAPVLDQTNVNARLPLVDLALPALRALAPPQYDAFRRSFWALVKADDRLGLFEWTLAQVLMRHLAPQFESVRSPGVQYYGLQKLPAEVSVLLSTLAHAGHGGEDAAGAFAEAAKLLPEARPKLLPRSECGMKPLQESLATLVTVAPRLRGRLIDACAASICHDGLVKVREAELLRGISDLLDCPMPPLVAGQEV